MVRGWVFAAFLAMSGPAIAQDAARGLAAYRAGDFAQAYAQWLPLAQAGDPVWQFNIAVMLNRGEGVARDPAASLTWFEAAATGGHLRAQTILAEQFERGERDTSLPQAIRWRRMAAQAGHGVSMVRLADHLRYGYFVGTDHVVDHDEALHWYNRALVALEREVLEDGNLQALWELAILYSSGPLSVEADRARAAQLFEVYVAETGDPAGMHSLGNIHSRSDDASVYDPALSYHWYRRAALAGLGTSQSEMSRLYALGEVVTRDMDKALLWHVLAGINGRGVTPTTLTNAYNGLAVEERAQLDARAQRCIARDYVDCGL